MSNLSDALEAMDKVRIVDQPDGSTYPVYDGGRECYDAIEKAKVEALAWIKEALPIVEEKARNLVQLKREYEVGIKLAVGYQIDRFEAEIKSITAELAALDALIARVKPEEANHA